MRADEMFGQGSVWKAIARMSIPAVVTMIVMVVYNMADTFFVGQLADPLQLAAISLASPVYMVMMAVGTLVGGGGCAAISHAYGEKNYKGIKAMSGACVILDVVASVLIGGIVLCFSDPILRFLGTDSTTYQYTKDYMMVLVLGMIFIVFSNSFANIIRSEGAAKESMIGNGIGTLLNMILDPLFILGLGMGVKGAAIATVIGNAVASVYYVFYILKSNTAISLNPRYIVGHWKVFGNVTFLGIPNAISSLLNGVVGTISNHVLMTYGAATIASVGVGGKATMIASMLVMGICMGSQPIIAFNFGAKNYERTKSVMTKLGIVSIVVGGTLTICCFLFRLPLAGMFLKDDTLMRQSAHIMEIQLLLAPFIGLYYIGINFLQSAGKAMLATILSIFRQFVCYVPAIYLFHRAFGLEGVFWVNPFCDAASILLAVFLLVRVMKKAQRELQSEQLEK